MPVTYEAHLTCILESPDDDGPRMVFADWLEDRGDLYGEYIRLELGLARMGTQPLVLGSADRRCDAIPRGDDYWEVEAVQEAVVGQRVDLLGQTIRSAKPITRYGLLVVKVLERRGEDDGWNRYSLKQDELSVKFDHAKHAALTARSRELFAAHEWEWTPKLLHQTLYNYGPKVKPGDSPNWAIPRTWRRGFIDELVLPTCEDWVGRSCPWCSGISSCSWCDGSGHIPGIGRDLVKVCPITFVGVADREPYYSAPQYNAGQARFIWFDAPVETARSHLGEVAKLLKGGHRYRGNNHNIGYESADAANRALSDVLIKSASNGDQADHVR